MKILMVNNQLSVLGGSETYMFGVGEELVRQGHEVQYFGRPDPNNVHGNDYGIYAKNSFNPFHQIRNSYNVKQFSKILDAFNPDIIHVNLIYFVLTPAILDEANKRGIPIIQTVHDPKIVCPNHRLYIVHKESPCLKCVGGEFGNCLKNKCVKKSRVLSLIATREANYYLKKKQYEKMDYYIFPSEFMRSIHIGNGVDLCKTSVLHNFSRIEKIHEIDEKKFFNKYVLFFGRVSPEKGLRTLVETIKSTPHINYVIVGTGPLEDCFENLDNCKTLGFKSGEELINLIRNASLCVFPSIWYENCPMSVLESIALGTPVIGANIGGIPELIDEGKTGLIFESGNARDLESKIIDLYEDDDKLKRFSNNCLSDHSLMDVHEYVKRLIEVYNNIKKKELLE